VFFQLHLAAAVRLGNVWMEKQSADFCMQGMQDSGMINYTCAQPCLPGLYTNGCLPPDEAYSTTDEEAFVATHVQETRVTSGGEPLAHNSYFIPFAEGFIVGLSYFFEVPRPAWHGSMQREAGLIQASSMRELRTVLLDSQGVQFRTIEPGAEIHPTAPCFKHNLCGTHGPASPGWCWSDFPEEA